MKNHIIIYLFALLLSFSATAQDTKKQKRKGITSTEKQVLKTDVESVSTLQTKKLSKFLNLSVNQVELVSNLISKHLKSEKYTELLSQLSSNSMSKAVQKEEVFDPLSAELFNDSDFTKDINLILDDGQQKNYKEMVHKFLTPR